MRPQSQLSQQIHQWILKSNGWFSYFRIDAALHIEGKKAKTLRRVICKRLCLQGKLIKAPDKNGVYKRFIPAKRIEW